MDGVKDALNNDLILTNAKVITMDPLQPKAGGVIIASGRIRGLLPAAADAAAGRGAGGRIIDCRGKTLLPGFIDCHFHLHALAEGFLSLDLGPGSGVGSISDMQSQLREFAGRFAPTQWIRARGYNEFYLAEKRHPNRRDLDAAAADHPVKLTHRSGHAHVLNSRALELVGISRTTADPRGGVIERDLATGEPTGLLFEMGDFLAKRIPALQAPELEEGIKAADQKLLAAGITSVYDTSAGNDARRWHLLRCWKQGGLLKPRVTVTLGLVGFAQQKSADFSTGLSSDQLRINGVKIILDETTGRLIPSQDELNALVLQIHRSGSQVAIHAVEENAVQSACRAIEFALKNFPRADHRHRIEHCSVCPPALSRQLAALGIMVVTQPAFIYFHGDRYLQTVAADQLPYLYPIATLFKQGVTVAGSSDCPIVPPDPLIGIYAAVARRSATGRPVLTAERIGHLQALRMYTRYAALAGFEEKHKGSITPGKLADLVLLSGDPSELPANEIKDLEVEMTVLDGKIVWNKNQPL
jgi:predicted amidohydrolase YtcJ